MLRKRSRTLQKDQYKDHLMPDSVSESCFKPDVLGQKHKSISVFSISGLFVGFSTKILPDSDSARSPTSPLDFRGFSNLGNSCRSPRSCHGQKSWDCSKVGLSIVDSLKDETKPLGKVLRSSESKNILFGSQMRNNIPNSCRHLYCSTDYVVIPNSLPKDYVISPDTQIKSPHLQLGSSDSVFGTGIFTLKPEPFGKIRSCLSDSGKSALTYSNPNSCLENFWSKSRTTRVNSPPIIGEGTSLDNSLGKKPSSLPISIGSDHVLMGSQIELSEDYTCVISHGPNPRTTHIYGDCILECNSNELANCCKKEVKGIGSPWVDKCPDGGSLYPPDDFLSFCYSCKKKLEEGKEIYMYREGRSRSKVDHKRKNVSPVVTSSSSFETLKPVAKTLVLKLGWFISSSSKTLKPLIACISTSNPSWTGKSAVGARMVSMPVVKPSRLLDFETSVFKKEKVTLAGHMTSIQQSFFSYTILVEPLSNEVRGWHKMKSLVLKLLRESIDGSTDFCNETIDNSCQMCLNSLLLLFRQAAKPGFTINLWTTKVLW
ncbi:hypothetical protein HHK36_014070 [Tetracentron sinense]|uniref:FLZ-type domain-containing protein n=1 Tax=Tetracentron sinense TaxID=13715 RepID=A0A834Z7J0_TETSI|nr:hypothetical protein HHK36_014070 [Tetracentron sinense]